MKYNYYSSLQKTITLLLVCLLSLTFASCDEEQVSQDETSEESIERVTLSNEEALDLVKLDRKITEIFINNSLCDGKSTAQAVELKSGEYASFSEVEALLNSVYTESSDNRDMFLSYPKGHTPSVSNIEGKTYVFNHLGSGYNDFIVTSTVNVLDTENENEKIITAQTESGKTVELKAVLENEKWLLESGVYASNINESDECEERFSLSNQGSFKGFSGNVLVIELFISDAESGFTSAEEAEFHGRVKSAFDYITEQSKSYGNEVTVTYEPAYFDHFAVLGTKSLDFDIFFAETGFGTLQKFAEHGEHKFDLASYDNYVFVVCMDKEIEASYALYNGEETTLIYFAERVIIGKTTTDAEICVSALKLLGAYGYDEEKCDQSVEKLYKTYFPNDVMTSKELSSSKMSPITAYACGITDKLRPLYRVFLYE